MIRFIFSLFVISILSPTQASDTDFLNKIQGQWSNHYCDYYADGLYTGTYDFVFSKDGYFKTVIQTFKKDPCKGGRSSLQTMREDYVKYIGKTSDGKQDEIFLMGETFKVSFFGKDTIRLCSDGAWKCRTLHRIP